MKIGVRMHDYGCMEATALARRLQADGVETGQLAIPKAITGIDSYFAVTDDALAGIKAAFAQSGVEIAVLGCYIEPALTDEGERMAQLATFREGIRCAAHLEAGCIATETTRYSGDEAGRAEQFDRLCRSVDWMLKEAQPLGVTVAIEPVRLHTLSTPELTARLLERFAGSGLAIIFDPVNLLTLAQAPRQSAFWQECTDAFGHAVTACHIKDARFNGEEQIPCRLGHGVMDYTVIAHWLKAHKPHMPLIREEIQMATAREDLQFLRDCFL